MNLRYDGIVAEFYLYLFGVVASTVVSATSRCLGVSRRAVHTFCLGPSDNRINNTITIGKNTAFAEAE